VSVINIFGQFGDEVLNGERDSSRILSGRSFFQVDRGNRKRHVMIGPKSRTCPVEEVAKRVHCYFFGFFTLGILIMFQLHHHRETACHSQPSVMHVTT